MTRRLGNEAGRSALRRVVEGMRADPEVLAQVVAAARTASGPVAALPTREVRRHIAALLGVVSAAFVADGTGLSREHAESAARLAIDRAVQGVSLEALLDGFLAGRTATLRIIAARLTGADVPSTALFEALIELDAYAGELQNQLVAAYQAAAASLDGSRSARLLALRAVLVHGAVEQLAAAGLAADGVYHCAVADSGDPVQARRAAAELTPRGGVSGLVEGHLCVVAPRGRLAGALAADALLVTAPAVPAGLLPVAYRLCRSALEAGRRRGRTGRAGLTELAVAVAADAVPGMGELLGIELLAELDPGNVAHRLLAETAAAHLDHGGRLAATARALHVHSNTVKHRLRRFAEATGCDTAASAAGPGRFADTVRWRWALEHWLS
ncbi:helix-turn-helix domain-containing protein [Kitasatospora sp. NPDC006697]|uniref:helix-turn-helix domain-containing protein n=1 Tax=Kitasatospora sp. NPDC006697 TaxID=3364020 RepID=UPI0036C484A0